MLKSALRAGYIVVGHRLFLVEMCAGFTLGNVVYIILEIQSQMSPSTTECSGTYGWTFVFRLVFIIAQTFFLFKNQTVRSSRPS